MADLTRKDMAKISTDRGVIGKRLKNLPEIVKPPLGVMYEGRANIGARNPLTVAMHKLEKMHQVVMFTGTNLKTLLETAFSEFRYEKMFDPRYGSPLYFGLYRATRRLAEWSPDEGRYADALQKIKVEPQPGEGAVPDECQNLIKSANPATTMGGKPLQFRDTAAGLTNNGLEFNDPMQGCVADCWFIAAITAVALAETINPAVKKLSRALPVYVCPPPTPSWATKKSIATDMSFYSTNNGTRPYYGYLKPDKVKPTFYESWASYYEKCFASYYQQNRTLTNGVFLTINNPNYDSINYKSAFGAIADLTGRPVTTASSNVTKNYFGTDQTSDKDENIIAKIRTDACGYGSALIDGEIKFVKRPAVAHTYLTLNYVPAVAQRADFDFPVAYNCAGLAANHTFTIMGVYQTGGIQYVVLRNPWGHSGNSADFSGALRGHLAANLTTLPAPLGTTNLGNEGIFGLDSQAFMRYFEEFGWPALWA